MAGLWIFIAGLALMFAWLFLWPHEKHERLTPTPNEVEDAAMAVIEASLLSEPQKWQAMKSLALGNKVDWIYNPEADVGLYREGTRVWVMSGAKDFTMATGKHIPSFNWQLRLHRAAKPLIDLAERGGDIHALKRIASGFRK